MGRLKFQIQAMSELEAISYIKKCFPMATFASCFDKFDQKHVSTATKTVNTLCKAIVQFVEISANTANSSVLDLNTEQL